MLEQIILMGAAAYGEDPYGEDPATGKSVRGEQQRELFQKTVPIPHPPAWLWVRGRDSGMQE